MLMIIIFINIRYYIEDSTEHKFFTYKHSLRCRYCTYRLKFAGYRRGMVIKMTLRNGQIGKQYKVRELNLQKSVAMRLEALGLTEGTSLFIQNNKKSGSVIFLVRGTRLAVGKKIAEAISIEE